MQLQTDSTYLPFFLSTYLPTTLLSRSPAGIPDPQPVEYVSGYCFSSAYAVQLLTMGYGFAETDSPITVIDDVNGTELGWALGEWSWSYS